MRLVRAWMMHLEVVVVLHRTSLLPQPRPSDASVFYEEVLAPPPNVILWAHVSRRRPRLIVLVSCRAHMILSKSSLLLCPTLACSSQHLPRNMSAPEVEHEQPLIVSPWRFLRKIASYRLASAASDQRSLCKHLRVLWRVPERRRAGETSMVNGRASNASARICSPDDVEVRSEVRRPRCRRWSMLKVRYYLHHAIDR
jgi:hypothetical protein